MPFADPDYLADLAQSILDGLTEAFTVAGRPPDRSVRCDGEPALDCPGLFVYMSTRLVSPGLDQDTRVMWHALRVAAAVSVTLARCRVAVPDDRTGVPAPAAVDTDGVGYHTDLWITQRALIDRLSDGTLVSGGSCTVSRLNPVVPIQPSGGFYGLTTTIDITLG